VSPLIEVEGVVKHFGGLYALGGLDLYVDEGEIVSGSVRTGGQSTLNVMTGPHPPDEGDIRYQGTSVIRLRPNQITKLGIARTFQNVHLFPNMTVLENAMVGQHCRTRSGVFGAILQLPSTRREEQRIRERAKQALGFFGPRLAGYRHQPASRCTRTAGDWRSRALATDPRVILLDEPTAGMNPRETLELRDHIVRMRDELQLTVLVIEHDMRVVKGVSDRVIACDYGRKIAEGTYEEVANDPQVIEAYLGTKAAG
jgi:ABC-type branched-subunit amino acid transport system ATPase component